MNPLANLQMPNIAGNTQNALMQGMQFGDAIRQRKQQEAQRMEAEAKRQATDDAYRGVMAGDANAINALAQIPGMAKDAYGMQQGQQQAQAQQAEANRAKMGKLASILDGVVDDPSYQRNLSVARQLGYDVSTAPANYDPNYISEQKVMASAFANEKDLPLIVQEVQAAGYQPGTPQFEQEVKRVLISKYSTSTTVSYQQGGGAIAYDRATGAERR